jgi:hypothetical protein
MQALARLRRYRGTSPRSYEPPPPGKIEAANSPARPSISSPPLLRIQDPHIWRRVNCLNPPKSRRKPQPESVPRGILQLFCRMTSVILQNDSAGSAARAALLAGNGGSRVIMRYIPHVSIYRLELAESDQLNPSRCLQQTIIVTLAVNDVRLAGTAVGNGNRLPSVLTRLRLLHQLSVAGLRWPSTTKAGIARGPSTTRGRADSELLVDAELHQPPHARAVGIPSVGFEGRRIPIQRIVDIQRELQTLPEPAATHVVAEE